jgi:hypothetical protein
VVLNLPKQLTYSVCFHPGYANNGFVNIFNNGPRDEPVRLNRISRYTVGREPPRRVDSAARTRSRSTASAGGATSPAAIQARIS